MLDGSRTILSVNLLNLRLKHTQLASKKFLEEEISTGTNFRELAFDHQNRENRENFCLAKISCYTVPDLGMRLGRLLLEVVSHFF